MSAAGALARLNDAEALARLRLFRTENVGPVTFDKLVARYGTAARALEALPDLSKRGGREIKPCPRADAEREMAQVAKFGARLVFKGDEFYPRLLAEIDDAPPVLTVLGDAALLSKPALGVVGARNASLVGKRIAADFAQKCGSAGFTIVSGLARGIDAAAHTATLDTGTVAVVAGGIDVIYPPENEKLYRAIAEKGAVVAESPFGAEPVAKLFPKRNRIVSGLSLGTLIVEAAAKSGSLITARLAAEQNREVFAVPGSPLDPRAEGTNGLIRDGAHLAATADDVIHVLRSLRHQPLRDSAANDWQGPPPVDSAPDSTLRDIILENLSPVPVSIDDLIRAVDASAQDVLTILLELELAGRVERRGGNKVNLI
jgi:DNA processing protein